MLVNVLRKKSKHQILNQASVFAKATPDRQDDGNVVIPRSLGIVARNDNVKGEILNVLVSSALTQYCISFGAVGQGHSIPRSLEIVVQDDGNVVIPRTLGIVGNDKKGVKD